MAKVLIVDDEPNIRILIDKALSKEGYITDVAEDGLIALKKISDFLPDLVITDIIMPNKEGVQLITELKAISPKTKIMAISGGGLIGPSAYLELARQLGADEVLTKPFKMEELMGKIHKLLS